MSKKEESFLSVNVSLNPNIVSYLQDLNKDLYGKVLAVTSQQVTLDFSSVMTVVVDAPDNGAKVGDTLGFGDDGKIKSVTRPKETKPVTKTKATCSNIPRTKC